jgi:anti-anti-sigma factor
MGMAELRHKLIAAVQGAVQVDLADETAVANYIDQLPLLQRGTAGGNTACVEIIAGDTQIIIDAGSGLRNLGLELMKGACGQGRGRIHLFLSHTHWDHIQGFPFFTPAYIPGNQITIYSIHDVADTLTDQMRPATFPVSLDYMQSDIRFQPIAVGEPLQIGGVNISAIELPHPGRAYAFRFERQGAVFVYASDAEYKYLDQISLQPYLRFYTGADALIFDAQFSLRDALLKEDWGHSSALIGVDIARQAGVKRLVLFHHDPVSSDEDLAQMVREAEQYADEQEFDAPLEILLGHEGLELNLTPADTFDLTMLPNGKIAVLRLVGDLDERVVADLQTHLQKLAKLPEMERPGLVVDLEATSRLSIAGLRLLIDLRRQWGGETLALAGSSEHVKRVIALANYLDYFAIYPNLSQALGAVEARQTLRLPGQMLRDRYRIEERIGKTELGVVLRATDTRLGRTVAIKTLSSFGPAASGRFLSQAQRMARLNSPNIVAIFDVDEEKGTVYQITEYVHEPTLREALNRPEQIRWLEIASEILLALEYAHSKGIVHGNLKPENVLLSTPVKLTDFGLRWIEEGQNLQEMPLLLGSPDYLAPEQILGQPVEPRTDLYAVGVVLYEMLTGRRPFTGEATAVLESQIHEQPRPLREFKPGISPSLEHLVLKLLSKNPEDRYADTLQTRRVLMRLSENEPPTAVAEKQPAARQKVNRAPMIGRTRQLKQLSDLWQLTGQGQGQCVFITGEAGVGKTRLAEELARQLEPASGFMGQCSDAERRTPYQPFMEAIRNYLRQIPQSQWESALGETASVMATILPELCEVMPGLSPIMIQDANQERQRLQDGWRQFLLQTAADQPRLLILDDFHWADAASLQILPYLARQVAEMPVMLLVTYRDADLPPEHPLAEMRQALSRYPHCHYLPLDRLDLDEVRQLLESIWRQSVPEDWAQAIFERTGGNPFYIEEVVKNLLDEKAVTMEDGLWQFKPLVSVRLPERVRDIVRQRVSRLSPVSQELLRLAAVLGQQFVFQDLTAVTDQPEQLLLESLDELLGRGILQETERSAELAFSHGEFQEVVYTDLNPVRRRLLHEQVAQALEAAAGDERHNIAGQLAYHFHQAGNNANCFAYSLQAARQANQRHAFETALSWYRDAVNHVDELPGLSLDERMTAYEGLGNMLRFHSRYPEAVIVYLKLVELARQSGDAALQSRALVRLADAQNNIGDNRTALANVSTAERLAREADKPLQLAQALYYKGWISRRLGDPATALQIGREALAISESIEPPAAREMAASLSLIGASYYTMGRPQEALDYEEKALNLFRQVNDQERVATLLNNLGATLFSMQEYDRARGYYEESLALHRRMGNRRGEIITLGSLGELLVRTGNYDLGLSRLQQALDLTESAGRLTQSLYRDMAEGYLGKEDLLQAFKYARKALTLAEESEEQEFIGRAWRVLGRVAAAWEGAADSAGTPPREVASARACFEKSDQLLTAVGAATQRALTLKAWAAYEQAQGNAGEAERLARQIASATI